MENGFSNYIDLKNDVYIRESNEFIFKIDFKNKKAIYALKEKNLNFETNISCSIKKDDEIILEYKLDEEKKLITIHLL